MEHFLSRARRWLRAERPARISRCLASALLLLCQAGGASAHDAASGSTAAKRPVRIAIEAPLPGSYALPPLGVAANGSVLDAAGRPWQLHDLYAGRVVVLGFVFTSCVDACPAAMAVLHEVRARLEADAALVDRTRLLTLSFDPDRDTPEVMRTYAAHWRTGRADWRFLTTASKRDLAPILEGYDQSFAPERDLEGRLTGQLAHVLRVFLIDAERRIRNIYSSSFLEPDIVVNDIRTLLLEDAKNAQVRSASSPPAEPRSPRVERSAIVPNPPLGLPPVPVPAVNSLTREKIALGRMLFFDRRLSRNGTMSCAMCHIPDQGFTNNEIATPVGIEGRTVRRNAPSLYNVAYAERLFLEGRAIALEAQIHGPLLAENEMGNSSASSLVERIRALPDYAVLFEHAFAGREVGMDTLGMALASYERTLISGDSPFDRWQFAGDRDALDESATRGHGLFVGPAGCAACHRIGDEYALFTDQATHNTGIGAGRKADVPPATQRVRLAPGVFVQMDAELVASVSEKPPGDLGRFELTGDPDDRWKYKTPSLRNVALTAPYMHDGSLRTLREVVEFYDAGGIPNENLDPKIRPLGLGKRGVADLVAFLESLTGADVDRLVAEAKATPIGDPR